MIDNINFGDSTLSLGMSRLKESKEKEANSAPQARVKRLFELIDKFKIIDSTLTKGGSCKKEANLALQAQVKQL